MIGALHDAVTSRRGFPVFLTLVAVAFCLLRVLFPDAPSSDDVKEQLWMAVDWRLGYGSGANPPLFTWLVRIVDAALGATLVSVEVVRFALLWLFCMLSAHVVRAISGDDRLAALAGIAPFTVVAIGWNALFHYTNTMLLIVSVPLTLAALLRLDRDGGWRAYGFFALVTAFGFYSKYTYAVVWLGFLAAALLDRRLRARLLSRRMALALVLAGLLLSPLLHWLAAHSGNLLSHGRARVAEPPHHPALPGPASALVDVAATAAGLVVPLVAMLLAVCPRAFFWRVPESGDAERTRWRALLGRYLGVVFALIVATILTLGIRQFEVRHALLLLPVLPWLFLRLAAAGFGGRPRQWLAAGMIGVILLVIAGTAVRGVTYAARKAAAMPQPYHITAN